MSDWFDELDLDPTSSWRRMGTRSLGDRPWLVVDDRRDEELALKERLLRDRRADVFVPAPDGPAEDVAGLVRAAGVAISASCDDRLEATARSVQEDLCLLQRRDDAWHLDAACLCFPSRWRLADKIGRPLVDVHAPTPGYDTHLADRVRNLLDRLGDPPVLRRNWFVHPDPSLFQPVAPEVDLTVRAADVMTGLHVRSERQTLRKLPSGWVLFTIRIQHDPLGVALDRPARIARFRRYVDQARPEDLAHRGLSPNQVAAVRDALRAGR